MANQTATEAAIMQTDFMKDIERLMDTYKGERLHVLTGRAPGKSHAAAMLSAVGVPVFRREATTTTTNVAVVGEETLTLDKVRTMMSELSMHKERLRANLVGFSGIKVIPDEFGFSDLQPAKYIPTAEVVFDHPGFPDARVEVHAVTIDSRNPRNPNPKAGAITEYELIGEAVTTPRKFPSLAQAKERARAIHNRAIQTQQPNFGRF